MKNEGFRNGMIELLVGFVWLLIMMVLPLGAAIVLAIVGLVGAFFLYEGQKNKKREFPVIFFKPDQQLSSTISDYYDQVKEGIKTHKKNTSWEYFVILPVFVIFIVLFLIWSKEIKMFAVMALIVAVIFVVACIALFGMNYTETRKFKIASTANCLVGKVEYYDASYDHHGRTAVTTYYVFVRKNGESLKLKVSKKVYNHVVSQQSGEGYLIKNPEGDGFFDVYDFIPVDYSAGFTNQFDERWNQVMK
ncbi:MAG: hypothetical protein Q4D51_06215 [Eubacteriales bacterium]|nr:hypothetical protein [Eubacteriales bacterium]